MKCSDRFGAALPLRGAAPQRSQSPSSQLLRRPPSSEGGAAAVGEGWVGVRRPSKCQ